MNNKIVHYFTCLFEVSSEFEIQIPIKMFVNPVSLCFNLQKPPVEPRNKIASIRLFLSELQRKTVEICKFPIFL